MNFTLRRLDQNDLATFGQLVDAEENFVAVTLEEPWKNNARAISCVPAGTYQAHRRVASENRHHYDVFELEKVPDRTAVQIHIGNTVKDTEGCILLGSNLGVVDGLHGITGSAAAFRKFMSLLTGVDRITLTIVDP